MSVIDFDSLNRSLAASRGHATRKAKQAARNREMEDAALRAEFRDAAAKAISDAAHHQAAFSTADAVNRAPADDYAKEAVVKLLQRAVTAGALRPIGPDTWAVVNEEDLCYAIFHRAA